MLRCRKELMIAFLAGTCAVACASSGATLPTSVERELIKGKPVIEEPALVDVFSVTRSEKNVPIIEVTGKKESTKKAFPPVLLLQKFSKWPDDTELRCVNYEGSAMLALGAKCSFPTTDGGPPTASEIANPPAKMFSILDSNIKQAEGRLSKLVSDAAREDCPVGGRTFTEYDSGDRSLRRVVLCDEQCLTQYLSCAQSKKSAEEVLQTVFARWREQNPKFEIPKSDDRMKVWLDLDEESWQGNGPWWLSWSSGVVPSAYGEPMLIGVGVADAGEDVSRATAINRASAEIAKLLASAVSIAKKPSGKTTVTAAQINVRTILPIAQFERDGKLYFLNGCNSKCYLNIGMHYRVKLNAGILAKAAAQNEAE